MNNLQKYYIQQITSLIEKSDYVPLSFKQLETRLNITRADEFTEFAKALVYMEEKGVVLRIKNDFYVSARANGMINGTIRFNARGYAFVRSGTEASEEIFIPASLCNFALHGDEVLVKLGPTQQSGECREGEVVKVIKRNLQKIVGIYVNDDIPLVIPDNKKILKAVHLENIINSKLVPGHKVVVKITDYPSSKNKNLIGEVVAILGHKNDPDVDILGIIHGYDLQLEFPQAVLAEVNKLNETISRAEISKRRDLRSEKIFTIDGADAKDLDDAISLTILPNGSYCLGVHIADVSHYVAEGSLIDQEALVRGTSVYLVDRVIPMLPHALSNDICSLKPHADRLTITCQMEIDHAGKVVNYEIFPSIISSRARMTYDEVNEILQHGNVTVTDKYEEFIPMLTEMQSLASILHNKRVQRGMIDFDLKTAKMVLDDAGNVEDIVVCERLIAEKLIEEFMLSANETVAECFYWLDVPFLYRIHEEPEASRLKKFFEFILHFNLIVKGKSQSIHPKILQNVLNSARNNPEELVISKVLLRAMMQAKYSENPKGHFGLATDYYTHFTSPIRRYPDLIVHRLIRTYLFQGQLDKTVQEKWQKEIPAIVTHCSNAERVAISAEREVEEIKKIEYMSQMLGEEFVGIISATTTFGFFVQLPNTIEGLVHVRNLHNDYFRFDERTLSLVGDLSNETYKIGDKVKVCVARTSKEDRVIDFTLVERLEAENKRTKQKNFQARNKMAKYKRATRKKQAAKGKSSD